MLFWASSETFQPASQAVNRARRCVEPHLNAEIAKSCVATLEIKLRYVPIVMPREMQARYPARSKLHVKARIYDCAPALDHQIFTDGGLKEQLDEYIRGVEGALPFLGRLGASAEQIAAFGSILGSSVSRIIVERPDQARH